jgi:hypothetical protein
MKSAGDEGAAGRTGASITGVVVVGTVSLIVVAIGIAGDVGSELFAESEFNALSLAPWCVSMARSPVIVEKGLAT